MVVKTSDDRNTERYASPLSHLESNVDEVSRRIEEHLKKMGLSWT